jgi:hypothetical protein
LCAVLLSRILGWRLIDTAIFLLLSGYAVLNALKFGQPYILVATSCILGWYAYLKRRPWVAGLCFGIFLPIKYFPLAILLYFACRREWRVVLGGALAVTAIVAASVAVLGWPLHETFLSSVLGNHLLARLNLQDPFSTSFQSFDVLSRRLLVFDSASNPHPWLEAPELQPILLAITKCALAAVAIATLVRLARLGDRAVGPSVGLIGLLVLLVAPSTATYHYCLIWLPVGLLVQHFTRERAPACAWFVLGAYALIGFLPYGHTNVFETRGVLAVLAFPRLWVLLALFAVCVRCLWTGTDLLPERATRRFALQ